MVAIIAEIYLNSCAFTTPSTSSSCSSSVEGGRGSLLISLCRQSIVIKCWKLSVAVKVVLGELGFDVEML